MLQVNEIMDERAMLKQQKNLIRELTMKIDELQKGTAQIQNQQLLQNLQVCFHSYNFVGNFQGVSWGSNLPP